MHIPDGFISPSVYLTAYLVSVPLWVISFGRFFRRYEENFHRVLLLSTFSLVVQNVMIPLPWSTSAHAIGTYVIGMLFGPMTSFVCQTIILVVSLVIKGGITVLPINALALGFLGPLVSYVLFKQLPEFKLKPFICAYVGVAVSALVIGFFLSLQYYLDPLYFSIHPKISLPALLIPHLLLVGPVEGIYTEMVIKVLRRI